MGYAQLVIGSAGSGKSTYCSSLHRHCLDNGRTLHIVNLDPAAEHFDYPVALDIREITNLDDVNYGGTWTGSQWWTYVPHGILLEDNLDDGL